MHFNTKISFYWLLIAFGLVIQSNIELMERVFFSVNSTKSNANGIPMAVHVLFIVSMIIPVIFSFLNTLITNKFFSWISIIYAAFLCVVNSYHFMADGISDLTNLSKIVTLLFIIFVNFALVISLYRFKKMYFK